jgi:MFS transporter, DHA3 family, macrolide efflux protein
VSDPQSSTQTYEPPPHGWRTFLILWSSQSVSVFGSALTFFAINIYLVLGLYPRDDQKPELAFALAATSLAFALGNVFSAPIAGAWADRHDRKRTMIVVDALNGMLSLLIAGLMATGTLQLWMLVLGSGLISVLFSFHYSAFDASYAMIVPEKQLPRANGMMQTIWALSGIVSPGIAAGIIALPELARQGAIPGGLGSWLSQLNNGAALAVAVDGITFFLAATVPLFLHIPSPKRTDLAPEAGKPKKSMWADIKEGALYIWRRRPLLWLLGSFTMINFLTAPLGVFAPLILRFNLEPDWSTRGFTYETALALMNSVGAAGGLAGGLLISTWGGLKRRRVYGVIVPMLIAGVALALYGFSPLLYLTAAMVFVIDGMVPLMNAHSQTIWQTQTPRELQGRVFSVRRLIAQFTWPLGTLIAGVAGGLFNPGTVMMVLGGILVLFTIGQLFNPYLLRVEDKAYLEELAAQRGDTNAQMALEGETEAAVESEAESEESEVEEEDVQPVGRS